MNEDLDRDLTRRWGTWLDVVIPGPALPEDLPVKVMQFNMCGSKCNEGGAGVAFAVAESITYRRPHAVMLNEVCLAQADLLWATLRPEGVLASGCFGISTGRSNCPGLAGERWYGNAIFCSGQGVGDPEVVQLTGKPTAVEKRNLTSMRANLEGREVIFSCAHLAPRTTDGYNQIQIEEVFGISEMRVFAGRPVVLGGDFNVTPRSLGIFYESGLFVEADHPDNSPTYKTRKIDYLFFSAPHFHPAGGRVTWSELSDHRPLFGEARMKA